LNPLDECTELKKFSFTMGVRQGADKNSFLGGRGGSLMDETVEK
jgi:hypothetical protein